jgi:hypothetical protein
MYIIALEEPKIVSSPASFSSISFNTMTLISPFATSPLVLCYILVETHPF